MTSPSSGSVTDQIGDGGGHVDGGLVGQQPSVFGESVTFTATVSSGAGVPTGSVVFSVDVTPPVSVDGSVNGVAPLTTSALCVSASPHSVTAVFTSDTGDFAELGSSVTDQTVTASDTLDGGRVGQQPVGVR